MTVCNYVSEEEQQIFCPDRENLGQSYPVPYSSLSLMNDKPKGGAPYCTVLLAALSLLSMEVDSTVNSSLQTGSMVAAEFPASCPVVVSFMKSM